MITGIVNSLLQPTIPVLVQDANGRAHQIEAVVDTGFTGFLTLSKALVTALGLPWLSSERSQIADGSEQRFDVHGAVVNWDGQPRAVEVEVTDIDPLVGMGFLKGHELRIKAVAGGTVTVEALP
jgi:clan AA aspartic protease